MGDEAAVATASNPPDVPEHFVGKYKHVKNENLDEYFSAVGVPFFPRRMMLISSPSMEISFANGKWTIKTTTMFRTTEITFAIGEEYEEKMPGNTLKSVTTQEGNKLVTKSTATNGAKATRTYEFDENGFVLIMESDKYEGAAKRYYNRIQ